MADETTLNPKEAEMAVSQLLKVVVNILLHGGTVQLRSFGPFRMTKSAVAYDTEAEVNGSKNQKSECSLHRKR